MKHEIIFPRLKHHAGILSTWCFDALFPKRCAICNTLGTFLCDTCWKSIPRRAEQVCAHCALRETPNGDTCFDCREKTPLDGIFAASRYRHTPLADTIHQFKYNFIHELATPLGKFLSETLERTDMSIPDIIIPVPLHSRRERWRGWNQSLLLAQELVSTFPSDIAPELRTDILIRTRYTAPQMSLGKRTSRENNVLDAFSRKENRHFQKETPPPTLKIVRNKRTEESTQTREKLSGKTIWLIDDVAATGSTLRECAKVLKIHGAKEVRGIVVAR